jgi:hypothetical protein
VEKDWSERFETTQASQRPWLVLIGFVIILGTIVTFDKTPGGFKLTFNDLLASVLFLP